MAFDGSAPGALRVGSGPGLGDPPDPQVLPGQIVAKLVGDDGGVPAPRGNQAHPSPEPQRTRAIDAPVDDGVQTPELCRW